jgi:Phosphotransferase enzyme family
MVTRDPEDLLDALHEELAARPDCRGVARADLERLDVAGIAHDHVRVRGLRLEGAPVLLRAPRLSQWGLEPADNLAYQQACFARAFPSGVTPRPLGALPVGPALPMGALLVEEIAGRKPRLPDEMAAIAQSLARIHELPVPPRADCAPLRYHENAVAGTLEAIETQAAFINAAGIAAPARAMIEEELAWAREFADEAASRPQTPRLVATDAHPGNFLVTEDGAAVFVDLEKMLYGAPAIDLAHASLYTSTMWDPEVAAALRPDEVAAFLAAYFEAAGPALADQVRPWVLPMRRLTWLRTLTWCIRWRVLSARAEDWSADRLDPATRAHVENIIADYLSPARIEAIRAEWQEAKLAAALI